MIVFLLFCSVPTGDVALQECTKFSLWRPL